MIDELFQYPDIDQSRINMMGVSYGGYMTYLYAVKGKHKDKISTYAPIAGITSWNLYHDEDIKEKYKIAALSQKVWMRRRLLPNVFVDDELEKQTAFEFLKERSPLTHIKNLERPMIVFQAINDERTPIEQTRIFVQKLNEYHDQNIPFKFKYKEVNFNHAGSLTNDIIDEITNFMNSESNNETLSASRINR